MANGGLLLHRLIINAQKGEVVDHIDGDRMNNIKSNLRICTRRDNNKNKTMYKTNKSGHKGVTWCKRNEKWMAYIMINKKHKTLGYFVDINDAIKVRKEAEEKYFGEFNRST